MKDENKKTARLIKQIQRGKQSAFEEFYKLTSPRAYFLALKITQNEQDAEDILQDSYIKAIEKINEIDTSQNVTSWFLKIVSNKSKDLLRSRNRLVFADDEEPFFEEIPEEKAEFCPEENLNQEELRLEVMAAIDELTAEKRACIMMMYFGDMSVREIAESIEVPESTVKNRLYTARKDLRTRFEKNGNILYGAMLGGVLIWALNKTSVTASAAFLASSASAEIAAGSASASTAVSAGTGVAAKVAAASVAQKIAVGVAATAVIGGSTAGVVTVVKNAAPDEPTTQITEAVTTAPDFTTEYAFNEIPLTETTSETVSSSLKEIFRTSTSTKPTAATTTEPECTTAPVTETTRIEPTTEKVATTSASRRTTTRRYSYIFTTTVTETETTEASEAETTTRRNRTTTTEAETTTVTKKETTRTTTQTTTETTTGPTTTRTETTSATVPTTTESTTESTTQAPATLIFDIIDMNGDVADTLSLTVDAGTEMTWEYLISLIKQNGYEAKAGVYGDGVGTIAESGKTYTFEAEL